MNTIRNSLLDVCDRNGADCFRPSPGDSKGSGYLDLSASVPVHNKLTLNAHAGYQSVSGYGKLDHVDWKLGLAYELKGFVLGAAWVAGDGTAVQSISCVF